MNLNRLIIIIILNSTATKCHDSTWPDSKCPDSKCPDSKCLDSKMSWFEMSGTCCTTWRGAMNLWIQIYKKRYKSRTFRIRTFWNQDILNQDILNQDMLNQDILNQVMLNHDVLWLYPIITVQYMFVIIPEDGHECRLLNKKIRTQRHGAEL